MTDVRISRLLVGVALVLGLAACGGSPDSTESSDPGTGVLGDGPTPSAVATADPTPESTATAGPTPSPTFTLFLPPDGFADLLSWPFPADCDAHNPGNVTISAGTIFNQFTWRILDGSTTVLTFKTEADAQQGLALAKSFGKHCYVGRNAVRTLDYWLDQSDNAVSIPNPDCVSYDPDNLTVVNSLLLGWQVKDGSTALKSLSTEADANNAKKVMTHYNRKCTVGTNYTGDDKADYLVDYFAKITIIIPPNVFPSLIQP